MNAMGRMFDEDRRQMRALRMSSALMGEMEDALGDCDRHAVQDRLIAALMRNGLTLITDEERAALGLEARDRQGWTPSERIQRAEQIAFLTHQAMKVTSFPALAAELKQEEG